MPYHAVFRVVVKNGWGHPFHQFDVEVSPADDPFESVKERLINRNYTILHRGISGVVFVRRSTKEAQVMKILILEREEMIQMLYSRSLQGHELLHANNLEEAETLFRANHQTIDVIVVNGCVEHADKELDTGPFIQKVIASGFKGPIVATSSNEGVRQDMLKAGCTHECEKHKLVNLLKQIIV